MTDIILPPITHVGFVVPDLDVAKKQYEPLYGPWTDMDANLDKPLLRGKETPCSIKLAFGKSGDIEIIQPLSGASPHQEFLDNGGNGLHHLRYDFANIDAEIPRFEHIGYSVLWYVRLNSDTAYCYLERDGDSLIIELAEEPSIVA